MLILKSFSPTSEAVTSLPIQLPGFRIHSIQKTDDQICIQAATYRKQAVCPSCGRTSRRIHSVYERKPRALPLSGQTARLKLRVRRFRCLISSCARKTFTERFPEFLPPRARRTTRLTTSLRHIGFALGGAAGARLAARLAMPVSRATLIRIVLSTPMATSPVPTVIGVDDWAWRKGHHYGTILIDLKAHRVLDLLPDRTAASLAASLTGYPSVRAVTRDRSLE